MIWGALPMWIPETREIRSIGGTADVSNCSGLGADPEAPLGRLGGEAVTGGTITGAAGGVLETVFGDGLGVGTGVGEAVGRGVAVGVGVGGTGVVTVSTALPLDAAKFPSPAYAALMVCLPTVSDETVSEA